MNVLDALLFGIRNVLFAGAEMPTRSAVNVHGAGVVVTDDVANERTDIEIPGSGPGAGLTVTAVKTTNYTAAIGELVRVDATAGDITIEAPTAVGHADERWGVLRVEPTLPVDHVVTISADDSINDEGSYLMPVARQAVIMRSDGSTWRVEGTYQATEFAPVAAALAAADATIDVNSQEITGVADGTLPSSAINKSQLDAAVAGVGGAPSRIVALDANDIIEWKLDEAVAPWANTGNGGALNLEAVGAKAQIIHGGSIHGDRCVQCDYNSDSYFRSPPTAVGESEAGTVHGWVRLADSTGAGRTLVSKDASGFGASPFSIVIGTDTAYAAGISVDVAGTRTGYDDSNSVEGWIPRQHWTHLAVTWAGGVVRVFINGRQLTKTGTHGAHTWAGGRWCIGYGNAYAANGDYSSWRVCNVARSAAYIDEVYRRAVGRWP